MRKSCVEAPPALFATETVFRPLSVPLVAGHVYVREYGEGGAIPAELAGVKPPASGGVGGVAEAGVAVARGGRDVERAARTGGAVVEVRAARIAVVRVRDRADGHARDGRARRVDLDGGRDRDRVADVVRAGEGVPVAARRERALRRGPDQGGRRAVRGAAVPRERPVLARERRREEAGGGAGLRLGVVGAGADGEAAGRVVARGAAAARRDAVDGERAAGRRGRVGHDREARVGRAARVVGDGDRLRAGVGAGGRGPCVGARVRRRRRDRRPRWRG